MAPAPAPPPPQDNEKFRIILRNLDRLNKRMDTVDTRTETNGKWIEQLGKMVDTHTVTEKRAECFDPKAEPVMLSLRAEISQIWDMVHGMKANQEEAVDQMQIQAAETSKLLKLVESNFAGFMDAAINKAKEAFVTDAITRERTRQLDANKMDHYQDQDQDQETGPTTQRKSQNGKGKGKEVVRPAIPRTAPLLVPPPPPLPPPPPPGPDRMDWTGEVEEVERLEREESAARHMARTSASHPLPSVPEPAARAPTKKTIVTTCNGGPHMTAVGISLRDG